MHGMIDTVLEYLSGRDGKLVECLNRTYEYGYTEVNPGVNSPLTLFLLW